MANETTSKNVFISHFGEDDEHVQSLKAKLAERGYQLRNSSIDSTKPNDATNEDYIKRLLKEGISWAGTFICLIGPDTHSREWIEWEIEQAHQMGKRIIGIYLNGVANDCQLPKNLDLYSDTIVSWRIDKIIDALDNQKIYTELPDGTSRSPRKSNRSDC
jgi:hypothetical protein